MRAIVGAVALLAFVAQPVSARTTAEVTRVCPFTGTEFKAEVEASGSRFCQRLDMKPVGAIGAPPLVPICPDDGFVVYKETFEPEEVSTLRGWVESDEFRRITAKESPYFRIAKTLERLSAPDDEVAWAYVQASWEIESDPETYAKRRHEQVEKLKVTDPERYKDELERFEREELLRTNPKAFFKARDAKRLQDLRRKRAEAAKN